MARATPFILGFSLVTGSAFAQQHAIDAPNTTGNDTKQGWAGLRVGFTRTDRDSATSLQFAGRGEELKTRGVFSTHGAHFFGIGGGTAGFDGGLGLLLTFGARVPVAPNHGPFARAGARGYLMGNRSFYNSVLELPRGEVGWQYIRDWTVLEIGASYGAVLTGRARVRDGGSINTTDAHACVIGMPFVLCGDMSTNARVFYGGVTLGAIPPAPRTAGTAPQP